MSTEASRLISLFSTKGGVGKTVLAANTSVAIFQQTQSPTVLVDLAIHYGQDMAKMLNL